MKKTVRHPLFFLSLAALLSASCGGGSDQAATKQGQNAPPKIEGYIVRPQAVGEQVQVTGVIQPAEQVALMPEMAGRVVMLHLPEGQAVTKGTVLVKLYDADLQAQLKKLQVQLKTAESTEERLKQLLSVNGISREEYDQAAMQTEVLRAEISNLEAQIAKTEIRAPFGGVIGLRHISEGAYVSPGMLLATIRDDRQLKLDFSVPESYASEMKKGMVVRFTFKDDTTNYQAELLATEQGVDNAALSLDVRALVSNRSEKLVPGTSVSVTIPIHASNAAFVVPTQAVIPQARFKTLIVARKGKAEYVKVTTGVRRPSDVQITSGIAEGDTIVTTGIQFIRPGAALKFTSVK